MYRVHIINMRNAYQCSPRFFVRAVGQFDSSRRRVLADFLASYELSPGTVVHAGYGARAVLQGVVPGALLIAATSRPAAFPSRRYECNSAAWSNVQSSHTWI